MKMPHKTSKKMSSSAKKDMPMKYETSKKDMPMKYMSYKMKAGGKKK